MQYKQDNRKAIADSWDYLFSMSFKKLSSLSLRLSQSKHTTNQAFQIFRQWYPIYTWNRINLVSPDSGQGVPWGHPDQPVDVTSAKNTNPCRPPLTVNTT